MNDSPVDCQSRRTDRSIFTAVKMQDRGFKSLSRNHVVQPKKILHRKTPIPQRFRDFFVPKLRGANKKIFWLSAFVSRCFVGAALIRPKADEPPGLRSKQSPGGAIQPAFVSGNAPYIQNSSDFGSLLDLPAANCIRSECRAAHPYG